MATQDITAAPKGSEGKILRTDEAYAKGMDGAASQACKEAERINAEYDRELERLIGAFEAELTPIRERHQEAMSDLVRRRAHALAMVEARRMGALTKAAAQRAMNGALTDLEG